MDYDKLKAIIKELSAKKLSRADSTTREVSLTAPPPTNAAGMLPFTPGSNVTEEDFYSCIDSNLHKVEQFTLQRVTLLRTEISAVEKAVASMGDAPSAAEKERCMALANNVADAFLTLEKYVNINFMGFHKILKKHDKNFPAYSCKQFYINRMHNQAWVRGDYSDVVVRLSYIYATVRDDHVAEEKGGGAQAFSRSTTKYWVRTENVSKVKTDYPVSAKLYPYLVVVDDDNKAHLPAGRVAKSKPWYLCCTRRNRSDSEGNADGSDYVKLLN